MSSSSALRRARIAGLAGTLLLAGLLVVPAPAQAGTLDGPATQTVASVTGSGSCTTTGTTNSTVPGTFAADGVPVQKTASISSTWTRTGNPADVTTVSATATTTVTASQVAGALRTLDLSTTFQSALTAALGTAQTCNVQMQTGASAVATFDLPTAKWATFETTSKNVFGGFGIQKTSGSEPGATLDQAYFVHTQATKEIYLPAGTYQVQSQAIGIHLAPTPTAASPATKSGFLTAHVSFEEPGTAASGATGTGTRYLDLGAARSCADGTLTGTWKSKAGKGKNVKIKKAVFRVDGAKVRTVRKPKKGTATTLTGLDAEQAPDVTVSLKLVKKGAGTVIVERSYRPCA